VSRDGSRAADKLYLVRAAAVLYVRRLDTMSAFYRECFGLEIAETTDDYCVLESGAWTLSLVLAPDSVAATFQASAPPVRRVGTPIKLAFHVPSIEGLRLVVARFGGQLDSAGTQWEFRGLRHCDGLDPEGNVVQMTEPLVHGARPAPLPR
jgi:catechol-2,3-dioxygenase